MRKLTCLAGLALLGALILADTFNDVEYIHQGDNGKGVREGGALLIDSAGKQIVFQNHAVPELTMPIDHISHLVYEKASKPRYAAGLLLAWPLLFTKSKQHFLTIQYKEGDQGKYAVFHLSKNNYREVLAAAEAATGLKVEREEEK